MKLPSFNWSFLVVSLRYSLNQQLKAKRSLKEVDTTMVYKLRQRSFAYKQKIPQLL